MSNDIKTPFGKITPRVSLFPIYYLLFIYGVVYIFPYGKNLISHYNLSIDSTGKSNLSLPLRSKSSTTVIQPYTFLPLFLIIGFTAGSIGLI